MTILGVSLDILSWIGTPEIIMDQAVIYLQFFCGSIGIGMYNIFVGIMQAIGDNSTRFTI